MTHLLQTAALLALVASAVVCDLRTRRIPNPLTLGGLATGLALRTATGFGALGSGALAAVLALVLCAPLVLAGGLGGGDAKLLAAVAAFVGLAALPVALFATAVTGGAMAMAAAARRGALRETLVHSGRLVRRALPGGPGGPVRTLATPGVLAIPYGVAIGVGALAGWWA